MKKSTYLFFTVLFLSLNFLTSTRSSAQTASTTIVYTGFQACGGCTVCGADYYCFNTLSSYCGNTAACNTRNFTDPVPPGNIVTNVTINYFSAQCTGGSLSATINGNAIPTVNEGNTGCPCSASPCGQSAGSSNNFPCGVPGYNNGGTNTLQLCTGANVCINRLVIVLTYAPANQATPATQPSSVLGATTLCPGVATTFSCPAVSNAATYGWTFPAGWTVNSGGTTNVVTATPGSAGNVCVRAENLCGNSAYTCIPVTLNTNSTPPTSASANPNPVCASASTTTLSLSGGSLGTAASWNWYSGSCGGTLVGTGSSITVSPGSTTTYFVRAVGTCNTTACASVVFTVNPAPTANAGPTRVLTCSTTNTTLSGSGGGTYSWTGPGIVSGGNTATPTINQPGTYSLVVTSAGCPSTVSTVAVTQNTTQPTVSASNTTTLNCATTTAALSGGPASGVTYQWSGPGFSGGTTSQNATATAPGTYTLLVTSTTNGCTNSAATTVVQNTTPPTVSASNTTTLNCSTTTAALSGGPSSGVTYQWSGPGFSGGTTSQNATATAPGTYTLVVTSTANSCTNSAVTTVVQNTTPPTVSASNTTTLGCTTTTAALSGGPASGVTYQWSGPGFSGGTTSQNAVATAPGTYTLVVTSTANSCTNAAMTTVSQNTTPPTVSASNSTTLGCATSTAALNGGPASGVTYQWSGPGFSGGTTSQNAVGTAPGTYTLVVTSTANSCTNSAMTTVTQNTTAPTVSASSTTTLSCATTTAALNGGPSSGVTYQWSGPGFSGGTTSQNAVGTAPGTYTLVVTSTVNSCTNSATATVAQDNSIPVASASNTTTLTCSTTTAALSGGPASGVTYQWSGPGFSGGTTSQNAVATAPGTYTLMITSTANSCTNVATTTVAQDITPPAATAATNGTLTCSTTTATLNGGPASGVTYQWSGPGFSGGTTSQDAIGTTAGTYTLLVTSSVNSCTNAAVTTITQDLSTPSVSAAAPGVLTCTLLSVDATLSTTTTPVSYTWTGTGITAGAGTNTVTVDQPGTYNYTVTNTNNGCVTTGSVAVTQNTTAPTVTMPATQTITCAAPSVTLIASASPANSNPVWTGGVSSGVNSYTATAASAGDYTLTVTDPANGCSGSGTTQVVPSAGFPIVNTSFSNPITCVTTTAQVIATTTTSPVSYSWTGPGVVSGAATSTADVNAGGQYTVVVQNTSSMCSSTVTIGVPVNTLATTPTISATGSITCLTPSLTISSSPSSGVTYTWSGSGIVSGTNSQNADVNQGGVYTLSVTNSDGCVGTETISIVSDNVVPTFTLGTASSVTTTCANPTATLSASSSVDPDATYTWITPTSTTLTGTPVTGSTPGVYTVVVTNTVNGCSTSLTSAQATVEVVADAGIPSTTLTANSVSITCANPAPSVTISTTSSPVTYSWSPATGIAPGTETTASPVFNAAGSYSVVVTNTVSGCATSISSNVVDVALDNAIPVISLSATTNTGNITCSVLSVMVTPTITPASGNLTYTWSPATGMSTPVNQASATFTDAGVYTLAVTNTVTGCVSSATSTAGTFTVTVDNTAPTATITAVSGNSVIGCGASNATVTLGSSITSVNTTALNWLPSNTSNSTLDVTTAGVYTLEVVDAVNGCSVTTQYTVTGSSTPPQNVDAGASAGIACGSSSLALNGSSTSTNVSYSWTGPTGTSIISGGNTTTPIVSEPGDYTLTVTDNATGCQSTDVVTVSQTNIVAGFTANPTSGLAPLTVNFTNTSTGASSYSWNFGDGNGSAAQDPSNIFVNSGSYTVIMTAMSGTCTGTYTMEIVVNDGLTLEIPNVFTPNGDNVNDVFTIKSTGIKEISLQIFNRWGEKLYEFSGAKAAWDGKVASGATATEGTYFYFVKASGFDDKEIEKNGTVNLFR